MNRCAKCGKEIPSDSIFCPFCGQVVAISGEPTHRQYASPAPENNQKHTMPKTKGKIVILVFSILLFLFLVVFAINYRDIVFGSFYPNTINPSAGVGVISYNLDTKEFSKDYLSKVHVAWSKKACGYIVKYSIRKETVKDAYISIDGTRSATREVIDVEIYDVHSGDTIATRTFYAHLPISASYFLSFDVDETEIEEWIEEKISNQ